MAGLFCWAPREGGVRPPHRLEGYRRELAAVRQGGLDGYCLHPTLVEEYPRGDPSWREVYLPD